jgi:hypothetical protein
MMMSAEENVRMMSNVDKWRSLVVPLEDEEQKQFDCTADYKSSLGDCLRY